MSPNDAHGIAHSVDPDQRSSLIWGRTVCSDLSDQKLRIITVIMLSLFWYDSTVAFARITKSDGLCSVSVQLLVRLRT